MTENLPLLKPRRLQPGQTLGLIAPASPINEDENIRAAVETLESLGFRVRPGEHLYRRHAYLAGTDAERAADLNAMFADSSIDGIVAICGGYGSPRILPLLDYVSIRAHPKVLLGYSDITALLMGIHARTGLVTFHGPVANQTFTPYTWNGFQQTLMEGTSNVQLGAALSFSSTPGAVERINRVTHWGSGSVRGPLLGGNLSLISSLCGTPYLPDFRGAILFLEDVGEDTYRLDRMLNQLLLAGVLDACAGLIFGKFTDCGTTASWPSQFVVEEVLADCSTRAGKPALRGLMIGHIPDQSTLPIGCQVEVNYDAGTLTLLEPGVI